MTRRVAMLTTSYPAFEGDPSGHFVEAEARALAAEGARVTVVAPGLAARSYGAGVELVRVGGDAAFGWPGVVARLSERPSRAAQLPGWMIRARAAVVTSGAEELIAHWAVPNVWPLSLGLAMTVEAVSHGTDVRMILRLPRMLRSRLVAQIVSRASRWRFVSEDLYEELASDLSFDLRRRLDVIAHVAASPIDLPDVSAHAAALRAQMAEERIYVIAARLIPGKRVDECLRWVAASEARRRARVVILGDGPEQDALTTLAASLDLRVLFLGTLPRRDALAWIAAADGLLHASREEGLSTVVREAEHYGRPVFAIRDAVTGATGES